jgi:hypothetical protein
MDILKSNIAVGIGAAVAATVLAPVLIPVLSRMGRPLAKSLIRGGMLFYEKSREAVALAGETVEDLIAEVRMEDAAASGPAAPVKPVRPAEEAPADGAVPRGADGGAQPEFGVRSVGNGSAIP